MTLHVAPWPPHSNLMTLPVFGVPSGVVPGLCVRHQPPQGIFYAELKLHTLLIEAFARHPTVQLECAHDPAKFWRALIAAAPLCCLLGDAVMEQLMRQVPQLWALRS